MGLESVTHISDLVSTNPVSASDNPRYSADHIQNIKKALLTDFAGITGAVTSTHTELNLLDGSTAGTVVASKVPVYTTAGSLIATKFYSVIYANGNSGASLTIDFNNGQYQSVTLNADCTFTFSNPAPGSQIRLILTQDATTGSRLVTWPTIKWMNSTAPTLSTATSAIDIIELFYDGSSYYGKYTLNYGTP